ncbi:MAG: HPr(Ser) kinase/phosphatase [Thermoanaerobaculia bacterium]|nr:HPr(Ser) kinase/phosphatase [Thermoanaerobaculia bacterium]
MAQPAYVEVAELLGNELADLHFRVLSGAVHLDRQITHPRVQKPGLAFAGFYEYIKAGRVQIIGESETRFLHTVKPVVRRERFERIVDPKVPCFVISKGLEPFPTFMELCKAREVPLLQTGALTSKTIKKVSFFLEDHLVPVTRLHGVLMDVYGLGVLLIGRSSVGKSEAGLDLLARGHSLVADDIVTVRRYPSDELIGYAEAPAKHHMELRGLGIVNIKDLFGLAAIRERKRIDLVIELQPWEEGKEYDRLGLDETVYEVLETAVPYVCMPVALGRNVASLVEVAARNHVLKLQGHDSAREFVGALEAKLEKEGRD